MYCSSCGSAVKPTLSYCNHCGAKLNGAKGDSITKPAEVSPESLVWAMVSVFVLGFGVIIGLMAVMKEVLNFHDGLIIFFTLLSFLLLLVLESVFTWMLLGRKRGAQAVGDAERLKEHAAKEFDTARARGLPEPVLSVTEHTTQSFEPALAKQPKIHE